MSYNVKGDMEVLRYATSNGKNLGTSVDEFTADDTGLVVLDAYSKDDLEEIFSVLPISKYGTNDYLPAGVAGSFEGASTNPSFKGRTLLLEDNGDLVLLRNGTNGSSRSVYYSYLPNALNTTNLSGFISTNKKYNPAYINNQYNPVYSIPSDSNTVFIYSEKISDLTPYYMVSLTTGTLNDTVHRGIVFSTSAFVGSPQFCMKGNTHVYIFTATSVTNTAPIAMHVYTIPIVDIQNQVASPVWTKVTGWNTTSFYNESFTAQDTIMVTNVTSSSNVADKPFMLIPSSGLSGYFINAGHGLDFFAAQNESTGMIRLKITFDSYAAINTGSLRPKTQFNILVNPSTKNCSVENLQAGTPLVISSDGTNLSQSGWAIINQALYTHMVNTWFTYCFSIKSGLTFTHRSGTTANEGNTIFRTYFNNGTSYPSSVFDALNIQLYQYSNSLFGFGNVNNTYASPVGGALKNIELLPNNNIRTGSTDSSSNTRVVRSEYLPPSTYTYSNFDGTTSQGFAPSINRAFLTSTSTQFISTLSTSQVVTTNGGVLTEYKLSTPLQFDQNAVGSGTISITSTVLVNLKNAMLSGVPSLNLAKTPRIALYVPQQSGIPVFAIVEAIRTDNQLYVKLVEVSTNARNGSITTATISRFVSEHILGFNAVEIQNAWHPYLTGVTIYEGSDFYGLMIDFPYFTTVVGNSASFNGTSKILKSNGQMLPLSNIGTTYPYPTGTNTYVAIPNNGFGVVDGNLNAVFSYTRLNFRTCGTTQADFDAFTLKPVAPVVVVSQDVPQGFIVYFTQETPVLLNGNSFILPISNINLTSIKANPANTTFHLYVILEEGLAKYHITENVIAESGTTAYNVFWIGTITTNNLQIQSINVLKRARLDIFGAALEATGSSFPVSYGLPSQSGTIHW